MDAWLDDNDGQQPMYGGLEDRRWAHTTPEFRELRQVADDDSQVGVTKIPNAGDETTQEHLKKVDECAASVLNAPEYKWSERWRQSGLSGGAKVV